MGRVDDKVAIVTGGASGIGRASAELLAREGAAVFIADLDEVRGKQVADGINEAGGRALAQRVDVGVPEQIQEMVEMAVDAFGALHVLFNNAADTSLATLERDGTIADMDIEVWDHCMNVDLRSAMLGCKYALPHLITAGGGSIINTSSNQALAGDLTQSAYATAKAGINNLTRYVATQAGGFGVRCNSVCPGLVRTPAAERGVPEAVWQEIAQHSPIERVGEPEDLAQLVLFLASDESRYVSGQIISVDGGQLAHMPHFAYLKQTGARTTSQKD